MKSIEISFFGVMVDKQTYQFTQKPFVEIELNNKDKVILCVN